MAGRPGHEGQAAGGATGSDARHAPGPGPARSGVASASLIATVASFLDPLEAVVKPLGKVAVAYSGGVDSSVVLAVSARVLGAGNVLAFTGVSETYRDDELAAASAFARELGVAHRTWRTRELDDPEFTSNPRERCYFCKHHLLDAMGKAGEAAGFGTLVDGLNRDDLDDERPGVRAAAEAGVRHPLVEAGLGKAAVRALARALDLPMWDRPANACLASRLAYGLSITPERLHQVAAAEDLLHEMGFGPELRVRHHGDIVRLEVPVDQVGRAAQADVRDALVRRLRALGFTYVTLDLQGFRSGSMNETPAGRHDAAGDGREAGPGPASPTTKR